MNSSFSPSWQTLARPRASTQLILVAVVSAWFVLIVLAGRLGFFHAGMSQPPIGTLAALVGPPLLFLGLLQIRGIREEVLKINPVWITAMQGLRMLGGGFLFVYALGHLPALFAYMAGFGDIIVALSASVVTAKLAMERGFLKSGWLERFHYLGLLDFVGAVVSGLIANGTIPLLENPEPTTVLGQLPLALIPCFVVPLWSCLHIVGLMQIFDARRASRKT